MLRVTACLIVLLAGTLWCRPVQAAGRWEVQFNHDVMDSQFVILDIAFPSPARGVAVGYEVVKTKTRPKSVVTSDGGRTWTDVRIKEPGLTLFFLNEAAGWMVTEKGVWKTLEAGRSWQKISKQKGILRVWFQNENHGWAVGSEKSIWETQDGGVTWTPLTAAAVPKTSKERTSYTWIEFGNPLYGVIVGASAPPQQNSSRLPDWMDPERASRRRQTPTSTIVLQTNDGGKVWKQSTVSMFGRIVRLRMGADGTGLALVRFQQQFKWPSELHRINLKEGETKSAYRDERKSITDVVLTENGAVMVGVELPGTLTQLTIPGRLVALHSQDLETWEEMETDYRAEARRAVLAYGGGSSIWIGTDTGMILKWSGE
jgi:photosynthesis system II assembly factor YCF48-like protein